MNIETPDNIEDIFRRIIDKCIKLIDLRYWDGIEKEKLLSWSKQFETNDEMLLAAAILNNLIYRSKIAVESFGANIFHIILPSLLEEMGIYEAPVLDDWVTLLSSTSCRQLPFRVSTIEGVDRFPGKSGSVIYRTLQRKFFDKNLGISFSSISSLPSDVKAVVFLDDILGTSEQFDSFICKNIDSMQNVKIIYIPLVAHKIGLDKIKNNHPNIIVNPVEVLTEDNSFFSETNILFKNMQSRNDMKGFYTDFCRRKKIKVKDISGHGELALTYCFFDSTPNNNLSVLWYKGTDWSELFPR